MKSLCGTAKQSQPLLVLNVRLTLSSEVFPELHIHVRVLQLLATSGTPSAQEGNGEFWASQPQSFSLWSKLVSSLLWETG